MIGRRIVAGALALAVLMPAGCSDGGPGEGEARLEVDGRALVSRDGGESEVVEGATDLHRGDRVEITDGVGRLELQRGTRMELRAGLGAAADSILVMDTTPVLEAGDLLVSTPEGLDVSAAGTTLSIDGGAARVSRALGVGVAAYDADVELDSAGVERTVPALRQMQVPSLGRPPQRPRPLVYQADDPWDLRFLGDAIALGETLQRLANGYTNNLRSGEGRTPGFFRLVLPGLEDEPDFGAELMDVERPPGETLVGAAITDLGSDGSFSKRWAEVFDFRDDGAEWGLVALDQEVSDTPLLGSIEQAVSSSPLAFVETAAAPPATAPVATPATPAGPDSPSPTTPPSPTTAAPPTTPPSTSPPPSPPLVVPDLPDTPLTPAIDPVIEPVTDLVAGLVGGLLGLLSPPP